ncbi:SET domain-containing protein-lysine N-methyltransferase [Mesorhizobium sp. M0843]|uniref:SET domain-containing protein-lysine N-methyltransferase n=1 Tax=Mesorhizobium sp. M0843 TaxID=2957010 RepID=UPI00333B4E84
MVNKIFDRNNTIYVKRVPGKGRGVFANIPFKVGDLIERAPTWGFDDSTAKLIDRTGLQEYYFVRDVSGARNDNVAGYVVFGFITIVNHSSQPNAQTMWTDQDSGAWAAIFAIKDISVDDEITHRYLNISAYPKSIKFIE